MSGWSAASWVGEKLKAAATSDFAKDTAKAAGRTTKKIVTSDTFKDGVKRAAQNETVRNKVKEAAQSQYVRDKAKDVAQSDWGRQKMSEAAQSQQVREAVAGAVLGGLGRKSSQPSGNYGYDANAAWEQGTSDTGTSYARTSDPGMQDGRHPQYSESQDMGAGMAKPSRPPPARPSAPPRPPPYAPGWDQQR